MKEGFPSEINGERVPYEKPTEELIRLVQEPGSWCWTAYYALARKPDPEAYGALIEATLSPDWRHRRAGCEALGLAPPTDAGLSRVLDLLDDPSEHVVRTALDVVARRSFAPARSGVIALAQSEEPVTRHYAVRALASIWEAGDIGLLLSVLRNDESEEVRREAGWALVENASLANWRVLVEEWRTDNLHRHRAWACKLLGTFGLSGDVETLKLLEQDEDGHVRKAARDAQLSIAERGSV